jgi:hypothetical protein
MSKLLARLQYIDVRIVYLFFALAAALPFVLPLRLSSPPSEQALGVYNAIEQCPPDKVVLIHSAWDQGIQGECWGQCQAVVEHMLRRGVKFIACSIDVSTAVPFFTKVMEQPAVKEICRKYNRKYGEDWVQLGFTVSGANFSTVQAMAKNFQAAYETDIYGTSLDDLTLTRHARSIRDVYMVYVIGYGCDVRWISFIRGVYGTKIAFACAGIQTSEYYPYLQSDQIVGMLAGVRGAAEYEQLVHSPGMASRLIVPQSFCHTLMILFVVLGNIGYFAARRIAAENEKGGR